MDLRPDQAVRGDQRGLPELGRSNAPSVSLRIRSDPPPPQAGQEGCNVLLTRIAGEVARRR
ncbi:MAG: hypothetical protein B7Z12_11705 [Caulobacter vibrioides]|uniref:Uncharacterized protein n=1 Tax=Caulobacter vibrioides TaxID=155892 RepID=A0A258D5P1_CAUVI|nr:MAG: hypothetical protein B7Z12_11705 [Caulobacter vibrioides]